MCIHLVELFLKVLCTKWDTVQELDKLHSLASPRSSESTDVVPSKESKQPRLNDAIYRNMCLNS